MRFSAMPAHAVSNANFTAYRSGDKLANLPRTGQFSSYAAGDDFAAYNKPKADAQQYALAVR